jgi:putative hydrolase of the HAD superfamily
MVKALMVDVDGVLVRGRPGDGRHWSAGLKADLGVDPAALHQRFFAPCWDEIVLGRAGLAECLAPVLRDIAAHVSPERLIAYWFAMDSNLDEALLAELSAVHRAGIRLHLATNQEHMRARHLMQEMEFSKYFGAIHYSAALGVRKPDAAFFVRVAAEAGMEPSDLLLIDDSTGNMEAARRAGWSALHWTGEKPLRDLLPSNLKHLLAG